MNLFRAMTPNGVPGGRAKRRALFVAAASAAVVIALSACSSSATPSSSGSSSKGSAIKIAVVADLTGTDATSDGLAASGIQAAVKKTNAAGGRQIDLSIFDAHSTPDQALVAARQAVSAKPAMIAYAGLSSGLLATKPVFAQANIPVVSVATVEELLTPTLEPWYFTIAAAPEQSAQGFIDVLKEKFGSLKGKKIAYHGLDSSAVNAILADTTTLLKKNGATVVDFEKSTGAAITSYTAQAQKIVSLKADAVISIDLVENFVIVGQALKSAGFNGPYLNPDAASSDPIFARLANPNFYGGRPYNLAAKGSEMAKAAAALGGDIDYTGTFYAYGWVVGQLAAKAASECTKTCTPASMTKAIESLHSYTPPGNATWGPLSFSKTRHDGLTAIQYFQWDAKTSKAVKHGTPITVK